MRSVVQVHLGPPPNKTTNTTWGRSSAGRAPALQAGGQEFDSPRLHQNRTLKTTQKKKDTVNTTLLLNNKKRPNEPNTLGQTRKCRMKKIMHKSNESQVRKGIRRMPRRQEPMKDAISCEKLWGAASRLRSIDIRMRELSRSNVLLS